MRVGLGAEVRRMDGSCLLLGSSSKIQFVLRLPCSFGRITRSVEKENEAM